MKPFLYITILVFGVLFTVEAQQTTTDAFVAMDGKWQFLHIRNTEGNNILPIADNDTFMLNTNGQFAYHLKAKNNLHARGWWEYNNDTLALHYATPSDTIRYYRIAFSETGDTLCLHESGIDYCFHRPYAKQGIDNIAAPAGGINPVNGWQLLQIFSLVGMCFPYFINRYPELSFLRGLTKSR